MRAIALLLATLPVLTTSLARASGPTCQASSAYGVDASGTHVLTLPLPACGFPGSPFSSYRPEGRQVVPFQLETPVDAVTAGVLPARGTRAGSDLLQSGQVSSEDFPTPPPLSNPQLQDRLPDDGKPPDSANKTVNERFTSLKQEAQETARNRAGQFAPSTLPDLMGRDYETNPGSAGRRPSYEPPELGGSEIPTDEIHGDDPVSPGTGEFVHRALDLHVPGIGVDFELSRIYRSRWAYRGPLGHGWTHSYDQSLDFTTSACGEIHALWKTGRGAIYRFRQTSLGSWQSDSSVDHTLRRSAAGDYAITSPGGVRHIFDSAGTLRRLEDLNGNAIIFTWLTTGSPGHGLTRRLNRVTDTLGRNFEFHYDGNDHLESVEAPALPGSRVRYTVDSAGRLERFTDRNGVSESYVYDYDPAREDTTFAEIPTDRLAEACALACGGSSDSCGGACRDAARTSELQCVANCSDTSVCREQCLTPETTSCIALRSAGVMTECKRLCKQGCISRPAPEYCEGLNPTNYPRPLPYGLPCSHGTWSDSLHHSLSPPVELYCYLPDQIRAEQEAIYEACKNHPPHVWTCLPGSGPRVGQPCRYPLGLAPSEHLCDAPSSHLPQDVRHGTRCHDIDFGCEAFAQGERAKCSLECADRTEVCADACRPHTICAQYSTYIPPLALLEGTGCWPELNGQYLAESCFGVIGLQSLLGGLINLIFGSQSYWTGATCTGTDCEPILAGGVVGPGTAPGWRCNYFKCGSNCTADCDDRCVERIEIACKALGTAHCNATCDDSCESAIVQDCINNAQTECTSLCSGPSLTSRCTELCSEPDWHQLCLEGCTEECLGLHDPCAGNPECSTRYYGARRDLNYNLKEIYDGGGRLYLRNDYQTDIHSPDFDKVIAQEFGGDAISYEYFDLDRINPDSSVAASTALYRPESHELCASTCSGVLGSPSDSGRERWVHMGGGSYLIFPDAVRLDDPLTRVWDPGVSGWPIDFGHEEGGLGAYSWYEIRLIDAMETLATLEPPAPLPAPLTIHTAAGDIVVEQLPGDFGTVDIRHGSAETLEAAFGPDLAGAFSLVRASSGWQAVPGAAVAAGQIGSEDACGDAFFVYADGPGSGLQFLPSLACQGVATIEEIGRRGGQWPGSDATSNAAGWDSLLTDPRGSLTWSFSGEGAPEVLAVGWNGDRFARDGLGSFGGPHCGPLGAPMVPDLGCEMALSSFGGSGYPAPDCGLPPLVRGLGPAPEPWPSPGDVGLGCSIGPDSLGPPLPPECRGEETYIVRHRPYGGRGAQQIRHLTRVTDPAGVPWLYYSDRHGVIQRVLNAETGAQIDWNYDDRGRLLGQRTPFGDRRCYEYDRSRNVVRDVHLPAGAQGGTEQRIERRAGYSAHGRVDWTMAADGEATEPDQELLWDPQGNLVEVRQRTSSHAVLLSRITHDGRGRPTQVIHPNGRVDTFSYDPTSGALATVTSGAGTAQARTRTITSDAEGRPTRVSEPGRPEVETFWSLGRKIIEGVRTDPTGPWLYSSRHYHPSGMMSRHSTSGELDVELGWNAQKLVEWSRRTALANGQPQEARECRRYVASRVVETIDPEGRVTRLERDANGDPVNVLRGVVATPGQWRTECSQNLQDPGLSGEERLEHLVRDMSRGGIVLERIQAPDSGRERRERYRYDGLGRVIEVEHGDGTLSRVGFDLRGRTQWAARIRAGAPPPSEALVAPAPSVHAPWLVGLETYAYDRLGRLRELRRAWFEDLPSGQRNHLGANGWLTSTFEYDDAQRRVVATDADGRVTVVEADLWDRETRSFLPDGVTSVTTEYLGPRTVRRTVAPTTNALGQDVTVSELTTFGAVERVLNGEGDELYRAEFDRAGRKIAEFAPGGSRRLVYDGFGRVVRIERGLEQPTPEVEMTFAYRRDGVIAAIGGPVSGVTRSYDRLGRLERELHGDGTSVRYRYPPGDHQAYEVTDRSGQITELEYDSMGRLELVTGRRFESGAVRTALVSYRWGVHGLEEMRSWRRSPTLGDFDEVVDTYAYDSAGRLVEEHASLFPGAPLRYVRAATGEARALTWPGGALSYTYEPLGRLEDVSFGAQLLAHYEYEGAGAPRRQSLGNGLVEEWSYDANGRNTRKLLSAGATPLATQRLLWAQDDTLARLDLELSGAPTRSSVFLTDARGRLEAAADHLGTAPAAGPGGGPASRQQIQAWLQGATSSEHFDFGPTGTASYVFRNGGDVQPVTGADGRYMNFGGPIATDPAGRVLGDPQGTIYQYDGLGRLSSASPASGPELRFRYDGAGRLVAWTQAGQEFRLQYAGGRILRETGGGQEVISVPGLQDAPLATVVHGSLVYNHQSFGGRLAHATNEAGQVVELYSYDAFGRPSIAAPDGTPRASSIAHNRQLLMGQPWFPSLGLHRQGQRWYRPEWGAFISPDPAGFIDGLNVFAYASNHPIRFVDPTGLGKQLANPRLN